MTSSLKAALKGLHRLSMAHKTGSALLPLILSLAKKSYIPEARPQGLCPYLATASVAETKHPGPTIRIHYLVNLSNQYSPTHPSTGSPLLPLKYPTPAEIPSPVLASSGFLLFLLALAAFVAPTLHPIVPSLGPPG